MKRAAIIAVSLVLLAWIWVAAASVIYCAGTGKIALLRFPFWQWIQVAPWWHLNTQMKIWVPLSAAVPTMLMLVSAIRFGQRVLIYKKKLARPSSGDLRKIESGVTDNHGHARWPTVEEMLKRYPLRDVEHGGVVIGEARRVDLEPVADTPFDPDDNRTWGMGGKAPLLIDRCVSSSPHSVLCIGTGGFKTMSAISTQLSWLGSIITFDPSCEIGPMVKEWREQLGQRVVFIGKNPGQCGIDVLSCIQPDKPDASSRILSMTASICGEEKGRTDKNSVFESAGRNLIAALMAHMMHDRSIPETQKTMESLVEGLTIPENDMQTALRAIHESSDSLQARRLAGIVMGTHKETFSGAYFSATQYAGWLLEPENARLLSGKLKPADILKGGLSIYIQIPTGSLIYVPGPGRVITDSIVSSILQADGNYAESMLLQADEARLLENMKSIEVVLLQGRKYGLALNMIYTSINDMRRVWTEDGLETWMDNVGWVGYAAVSSKTAETLSKLIGKRGVMAYSEGTNRGNSGQVLGTLSRSQGANTNVHEISRPLILPEEFKDCRTDELFVIPRTGRPFRCGLSPYFRRPEMVDKVRQTKFRRGHAA